MGFGKAQKQKRNLDRKAKETTSSKQRRTELQSLDDRASYMFEINGRLWFMCGASMKAMFLK